MNEPTMETLARRLDLVERRSRRLKWVIAILTAVMFAGFVFELWVLERRLHSLILGSANILELNTQRVSLKMWGSPETASFITTGDGASLNMTGPRGTIRLDTAVLLENDGPQLTLYDKKGEGNARAVLQLDKEGEPRLTLYDEENGARAMLGSVPLKITRPGPGGSTVEVEEKIPAGLVFFDKNGKVIWSAP